MAGPMERLKGWARTVKRDAIALWLALRDPRTPLIAKLIATVVVAYAFSPIDLIPDFIPVLGFVDDALLLPLGILIAARLIPSALMSEFRSNAAYIGERPVSRAGMVAIVGLWAITFSLTAWAALHWAIPA